jgi:hypothetical protein
MEKSEMSEYQKFFASALKKFGVESPTDFKNDGEKKKFFDYIDKNWKGEKNEETIQETPSTQLRNMVLEIIKSHGKQGIDFDTLMIEMLKKVGIPRRNLEKLVNQVLEWWEESGTIYATANKRTMQKLWHSEEVEMDKIGEKHSEIVSEANAFLKARSIAMWEKKDNFEFNGKIFPIIKVKGEE